MAGGHRAGTAPSTGYKFEDDVKIIFGTDSDATLDFDSATGKVRYEGAIDWVHDATFTLGSNRAVVFQVNKGDASEGADIIKFQISNATDRARVSWYDHLSNRVVYLGAHETNFSDAASHQQFEIKTANAAVSADRTRLGIGYKQDNALVRWQYISENRYTNPASTPHQFVFQETDSGAATRQIGLLKIYLDGSDHTFWDIDPYTATAAKNGIVRFGRNINTAGSWNTEWYKGDNTATKTAQIAGPTGEFSWTSGTGFLVTLRHAATAARIITFPDAAITVAGIGLAQTWTAVQTFQSTPAMDAIAERTATAGVTIDGLLLKDSIVGASGASIGFFGIGPVTRPTTYTQTYATADKTHAARTAAALTDNTAGTVTTTLAALTAITAAPVDTGAARLTDVQAMRLEIRNALASLADQVNKLRTDHLDTASLANSIVDDFQALGLLQ